MSGSRRQATWRVRAVVVAGARAHRFYLRAGYTLSKASRLFPKEVGKRR